SDALVGLDHHRSLAGGIEVDELVALLPRVLAHQLMADAFFREHQTDLAGKGAERELEELPHGGAALARGRGASSAWDNSDRAGSRAHARAIAAHAGGPRSPRGAPGSLP